MDEPAWGCWYEIFYNTLPTSNQLISFLQNIFLSQSEDILLSPTIDYKSPVGTLSLLTLLVSIALGHCRLSIVDLSSDGTQPFHSPDDTIHCVVNGEIYDYERIRAEIIRDYGYEFKSKSDSEIVVALYKHFGLSFFSQLRGEFALCLYDEAQELFIAARDRFGIKPLFWTVIGSKLLVASEMKAFLPFGWKPEWDVRSLFDVGWITDTRTSFKNVQKVYFHLRY